MQYPEYLTYSQDYTYRVCADISIVALQEARKRLGERGLYVVADVANLPFAPDAFDGVVSLHTLHHLPLEDQTRAYSELYRVLAPASTAVVVNGWTESPLMRRWTRLVRPGRSGWAAGLPACAASPPRKRRPKKPAPPTGTFVRKLNAAWLREQLGSQMDLQIRVWRSVSVRLLRALIHALTGGQAVAAPALLAWKSASRSWFGENGQYPLIVIESKTAEALH